MPILYDKAKKRYRYQLHRHVNGQRVRANKILPAGWSRAQAETFDRLETARIIGELTGVVERGAAQIEHAVEIYLRERVINLKSEKSVLDDLALMHGWYAGRTFDDLPAIAREYIAASRTTLAAATIKKRLTIIRAACRYAWKHHNMGEADPGARMAMPEVKNARHIYPQRADVLPIARRMPRTRRAILLIAFYSGMRIGEVLRATVADDAFWLADTKNGTPRLVPIHPRIRSYARHLPRLQQQRGDTISKSFRSAADACGKPEVRFHDSRHGAASEMINAEIDLYTVGQVLGHKSGASTQRYAHLAQARLRHAVNRIGSRILSPDPKAEKGTRPKKAA